jgi:hypothetical protein
MIAFPLIHSSGWLAGAESSKRRLSRLILDGRPSLPLRVNRILQAYDRRASRQVRPAVTCVCTPLVTRVRRRPLYRTSARA